MTKKLLESEETKALNPDHLYLVEYEKTGGSFYVYETLQ
jgi:hypothetical protein